jgi:hypothetical protein
VPENLSSTSHLFGPLKQKLEGDRFHNNQEVETVVREWLPLQQPDSYWAEISKAFQDYGKE